jgi:hypothetical protein
MKPDDLLDLIITDGPPQPQKKTRDRPKSNDQGKQTQADRLIEIATRDDVELYHTPDGTAYADIDSVPPARSVPCW